MTRAELIARLEAATAGTADLDQEIAETILGWKQYALAWGSGWHDAKGMAHGWHDIPKSTRSLDAALTLIPDGWRINFAGQTAGPDWFFELIKRNGPGRGDRIWAKTPALALVIAALKAGDQDAG